MTDEPTEGMRLAKFLARAGLGSRRASEKQIKAGKIQVNGQVCTNPATKVDPKRDKVFAGRRRMVIPKKVSDGGELFLAYKPEKMVTTMSDPQGRPTVKDLLPDRTARLFPVGRLDYDAEGALLFTSDGDLAHRLLHPSFHVPKIYLVKVKGEPSEASLEKLRKGVRLDDGRTKPCRVQRVRKAKTNTWVEIELNEGRYRQIKRMFWKIKHPVQRLIRVSFGGISVEEMEPGHIRLCTPAERHTLMSWGQEADLSLSFED